jgi:transcriptional regulator with XRE-family HTH domain
VRIVQPERLLARYVQSERKRRGWSQRDLAERLGKVGMDIHATGITRLERGERAIRFNEFVALCQAFERTVEEVFAALATVTEVGGRVVEAQARLEVSFHADAVGLTDSATVELVEGPRTIEEVAERVRLIVGTAHEMIDEVLAPDTVRAVASVPTPTGAGRGDQEADDGVDQ